MWFSIVLARADFYFRAATPREVERATEIAPRNTEYLALRALQIEYDGGDSRPLTRRIAEMNPMSSAPRIRLGLAAEVAGDTAGAERWLLDAASVDHQFEPRWTLANFYFRAGRRDEFFQWMRLALESSYGDRNPAFDLCWRMSADSAEILDRAVPERHAVAGAYLEYLLQRKRDAALPAVAKRLAAYRDAGDIQALLRVCDHLIESGDSAALDVWALAGQSAPSGIFNGDFAAEPLNHGFDWRMIEWPGVTHVNLSAPSGHRIVLSGQQPESCLLLKETLKLGEGKRYRFQWETRTDGIKSPSGFEWRIGGQHVAIVTSDDWTQGELTFSAPQGFCWLELIYQRPVGESRAEGNVEIRRVRVTEVAP